ncbi:MAG: T9SS type A sorting domain-containing protein [Arcticibacter sp.]
MKNSTLRFWALIGIMLMAKLSNGQALPFTATWNDKYQNTSSNDFSNEARKVVANPSNGFVYVLADVSSDLDLAGVQTTQTFNYTVLLQYDSLGSLLNTVTINVGAHTVVGFSRFSGFGLELDASGNVYVGYNSFTTPTSYDVNISKYTSNLSLLWNYQFNPTSSDVGIDMKVSTTGIAYSIVKSIGTGGAVRHRIIRAFGSGSSITTYFNFTITNDYYTSLAIDNAQFLYLAGYRPSAVSGTGKLISTACVSTGSTPFLKWSSIDNCGTVAGDDVAKHIVVGPDGFLYMVGSSTGNAQHGMDAFTFKLAPTTGKKVWENFINNTLTDGAFLVNVPDLSTVNVGWTSGSTASVDQINASTGLLNRRVSYTPAPVSPYTSLGQTTITGMVTSTVGKNVYMTGTIGVNNSGQLFEAGWLVKFNFSSRGTARIENFADANGSFSQSIRSVGLALDNSRGIIYWLKDFAEDASNHLQEKVEITALEGAGTFRIHDESTNLNPLALQVSPNPAAEQLFINKGDVEGDWRIFNSLGSLVASGHINKSESLNISNLTEGLYLLEIFGHPKISFVKASK